MSTYVMFEYTSSENENCLLCFVCAVKRAVKLDKTVEDIEIRTDNYRHHECADCGEFLSNCISS